MSYLDSIRATVPQPLLEAIGLPGGPVPCVELLLQLVAGAVCPADLQAKHGGRWKDGQERFLARVGGSTGLGKRARADNVDGEAEGSAETNGTQAGPSAKKPRVAATIIDDAEARGEPCYTLHAISVSSPIRKKVDVTITTTSVLLRIPDGGELAHPPIALSSLKRAFVVTNLGKNRNKPHWTVILPAADVVNKSDASSQMQVVFSVDHAPNVKELFSATDHTKTSPSRTSYPKGTETFPLLQSFLSFLPPSTSPIIASETSQQQIYKSSFGQPYLDTYRAAKEGSLYFLAEGILWAESKPAEFFALEDLAPDSDDPSLGGVRTLSATGRTFSLYIRRWIRAEDEKKKKKKGDDESDSDDEGILVDETEFSISDGREQGCVMEWIRRHKRKFGQISSVSAKEKAEQKAPQSNGKVDKGKGKATAIEVADDDDTDEEDEDFVASSSSESSSSDSEDSEEGSGGAGGAEAEGEAVDSDEEDEENGDVEMEDEMSAERHPLLRSGAMPRMSKVAMDQHQEFPARIALKRSTTKSSSSIALFCCCCLSPSRVEHTLSSLSRSVVRLQRPIPANRSLQPPARRRTNPGFRTTTVTIIRGSSNDSLPMHSPSQTTSFTLYLD